MIVVNGNTKINILPLFSWFNIFNKSLLYLSLINTQKGLKIMKFNKKNILFNDKVDNVNQVFEEISLFAKNQSYIKDYKLLVSEFRKRENQGSTGFEDGFAIPHALSSEVEDVKIIILKNEKGINWKTLDNQKIKVAIALLIPKNKKNNHHIDILSTIARQLLNKDFKEILKSNDADAITQEINKAIENIDQNQVLQDKSTVKAVTNKPLNVIGVSACTTGVAHTYMVKDRMEKQCAEKGINAHWETQGSKGQEYLLSDKQIADADLVIITADINVELDRFAGKRVYVTNTHEALDQGVKLVEIADQKATLYSGSGGGNFLVNSKTNNQLLKHLLSGVSYMIPFVVFSGLMFAILSGIGHWIHGIDYKFDDNSILSIMYNASQVGFTFMIPIMAGFIANSIAGRAAIAPAMISSYVSTQNKFWYMYGDTFTAAHTASLALLGALIFGLLAGVIVKQVNKIKVHEHIAAIMPIIIVPLFVTAFLTLPLVFIGAPSGWAMYEFNYGLQTAGKINGVNFLIGFIIGAMIGFDLGGPINKIAVLAATGLMASGNYYLMGAAAAAIPIPPLGSGLAALIFRKKFKDDYGLGVSAVSLGFMGITEGSIPFAVKHTWKVITPNILCSALAGGMAFALQIKGYVGAWGGPIITLFGGVGNRWHFMFNSPILTGTILFYIIIISASLLHAFMFYTLSSRKAVVTEEDDIVENLELNSEVQEEIAI